MFPNVKMKPGTFLSLASFQLPAEHLLGSVVLIAFMEYRNQNSCLMTAQLLSMKHASVADVMERVNFFYFDTVIRRPLISRTHASQLLNAPCTASNAKPADERMRRNKKKQDINEKSLHFEWYHSTGSEIRLYCHRTGTLLTSNSGGSSSRRRT